MLTSIIICTQAFHKRQTPSHKGPQRDNKQICSCKRELAGRLTVHLSSLLMRGFGTRSAPSKAPAFDSQAAGAVFDEHADPDELGWMNMDGIAALCEVIKVEMKDTRLNNSVDLVIQLETRNRCRI